MKQPIILHAGEGRKYELGKITALFKADEAATDGIYSVSEWWLEPNCDGVEAHSHEENDEVFYVLQGRPRILVGERWVALKAGAFVRIPAGVMHDFCNRTSERAGLLNFFIPGGFERNMPAIAKWFEDNSS